MPDITVHRHGDRWAVREDGAESPIAEFPSRAAAESAARQRAEGGRVRVEEEDPTGLAGGPRSGEDQSGPEPGADGLTQRERIRTDQGGL